MGNTPNVRFKGFTEDWEQRKLGDVAQEFKSGNSLKADKIDITSDYPVYGGNGLRGYTSTYNHDGEYALIGRQGALCGNMNYSVGKAYFTEHAVVVKADANNDTRFLYYMLDTMNLGQYSDQSAQPGLAVNKLVKLENRFPIKEEQQRIGWYFNNLDHLITLHQQKCDETKEFKKYMLQNMFPQKDEKVPKIRFDGFTGDWEQRKLSEISDFITKGATPTTYGYDWQESGIPFFRNDAIKDNKFSYGDFSYISEEANEALQRSEIHGDDILVAITGDIGKAGIVPKSIEKGNINQHTARVRIIKDAIPYFVYQSLITDKQQKKYQLIKTGLSMPQLSLQQIRDTIILCPSVEEQSMIGECFINLDNLITLHQQKCNALKEFKKYMLQNMFPQKGENKCQN